MSELEHEAAGKPAAGPSAVEPTEEPFVPRIVLVCADDRVLGDGLRRMSLEGLSIQRATGWGEALALGRSLRPAAVLLDSGFLAGAGSQLCAALRRAWGRVETPVLVLCRGAGEVRRALAAGASDVAGKPVDWPVVVRRLRALVDGHRAATELDHSRRQLAQAESVVAEAQARYEQGSRIDSLTCLPNRGQLERLVSSALAAGTGSPALLALDFDRFSELNEALGRRGGDAILRQAAERLVGCLRAWPAESGAHPGLVSIGRLGGDEFAILVQRGEKGMLEGLARSILEAMRVGLEVDGTAVHLSLSVGIAAAGERESAETLLQHAETAMYTAKRRGGAQFASYSEDLGVATQSRLRLDRRLREAFEGGGLELHYQPMVAATSRRVLGVEALLRWCDRERGWIPPAEFIPVAEDTGQMEAIGLWVLETACRQLRDWLDNGLPAIRVAVNVSRCQLESNDFALQVARVLRDTNLPPDCLELELSERGALRRDPTIRSQLRRLCALGVRLVVDDFGTGDAAIGSLRGHNLDGLKIDGSFVRQEGGDADGPALAAAMAAMARQLRLQVVAEGVETELELERVRAYGCDAVQGFLFSRPLPPAELRERVVPSPDPAGGCVLAAA